MATTQASLFFISLILLAVGLTFISVYISLITVRISASIAWFVLAIAFITGALGPGFGEEWVQAVVILFMVMTFTPLLMQMRTIVRYEQRRENSTRSWTSFASKSQLEDVPPDRYSEYRQRLREIVKKRNS